MLRFSDPVIGTKKEREPVPPSGKKTQLTYPNREGTLEEKKTIVMIPFSTL